MNIMIDGQKIRSEAEFHKELATALKFPYWYGSNINALWDLLTTGVERPLHLIWRDSSVSAAAMPLRFPELIALLRKVEDTDKAASYTGKFTLQLS